MDHLTVEILNDLLHTLHDQGYDVIGPRIDGTAIMLGDLREVTQLPAGVTEIQSAGKYTLHRNGTPALFAHTVGPLNWKRYLFPPERLLTRSHRAGRELTFDEGDATPPRPKAFVGVRPCDLAALAILDKVFMGTDFQDPRYAAIRKELLIVAVNCTQPGGTCFCASMGTGPAATSGYDLCLTEMVTAQDHAFLCEAGTSRGRELLASLDVSSAEPAAEREAAALLREAANRMGRTVDTSGLDEFLMKSYDNPRWEQAGERCMTCANCTMVCPTCFCSTVDDVTDLKGGEAERQRRWDSCFTLEFSHIHGGSVRQSASSRYRQWLMHKFGTWHAQFGTSGCVGCGRCITWCPVGIDVTHEIEALRKQSLVSPPEPNGD